MYITRRERFSSSHKLINDQLTSKENRNLFGKCSDLHGHNYELFVTINGAINQKTGFVVDLKKLKEVIQDKIINKLDHQHLNDVVFMKNKISTTENLCIAIWNQLETEVRKIGGQLYKIKIKETENNYFEYLGSTKVK